MGTNITSKTIEEKNILSNEPNFDEECENKKNYYYRTEFVIINIKNRKILKI
jgi:hypothetical protein